MKNQIKDQVATAIIGGDFVPTQSNASLFASGDVDRLIGKKCIELIESVDYRIINLEAPLSNKLSPILKWGPTLSAPTETASVLKKMRIDVAGIANNHIMDQGIAGLKYTMDTLDANKIQYVGAGLSRDKSSNVLSNKIKDKTISIYACCENEFSTLFDGGIGANPFDVFETFDHIKEAKNHCDFLIVLFHGGIEQYRYPTPRMRKIAHKAIDCGADVFIYQHSHCVGAFEEYHGKTIVYGQGNFLFDAEDNEFWNSGMLVKLMFDEKIEVEYIPIVKRDNGIVLAEGKECSDILESFYQRSKEITRLDFIEKKLREYARENIYNYLKFFGGRLTVNKAYRGMDKLTNNALSKKNYDEKCVACILDYMRCESLNDFIVAGCSELLNDVGDL